MKESITIKNFGPIKDICIEDIRPLTVFIGESGSGKSTIMKVIALFRWIFKRVSIRSYLKYASISQSPFKFDFKQYLKNSGFSNYLKNDTEIVYIRDGVEISYKKGLNASVMLDKGELSLEKMSFIADKRNLIPDLLTQKKRPDEDSLSFFLKETYNDFITSSEYVQNLSIDYLGIKYALEQTSNGTKYYIKNSIEGENNYAVSFEDASSGMQTVVPLSIIVEYFAKYYDFSKQFNKIIFNYMAQNDNLKDFRSTQNIGDIVHKNIHIHIEEPELSLYPESQRSLLNFLVNRTMVEPHAGYYMTLMLATHSPYIVNQLNLLIKAFDTNNTIENAAINYNDIAVYQIEDGRICDLKIQNEHLINTNPLSDTINDIYDDYDCLTK
jgi:predicted ATP-dependent endonuclease of OLD family